MNKRSTGRKKSASTSKGEKQYQSAIKRVRRQGAARLGLMTTWAYHDDPKRLAFTFARYKFVAKMLAGSTHVLEAGCGDAFVSRVVRQSVKRLTAVDFDQSFVDDANSRPDDRWPIECFQHDLLDAPVPGRFDGIYSLDVLEHIPQSKERRFLDNLLASLNSNGVLIIGMPSLQSQAYASPQSKVGHVNCKDQNDLKRLLSDYFHNVFMFSMNDEIVHTGYHAMAHYHLALCCAKKVPTGRLGPRARKWDSKVSRG
jgi:2-polyprenyl-3-methyl-5-hydroxy-6-metoxy-1,4-benzoquinol methylase